MKPLTLKVLSSKTKVHVLGGILDEIVVCVFSLDNEILENFTEQW